LVFVLFVCCTRRGKGLLNINIFDSSNSSREVKSLERNINTSELDQEIPVVIKSQDAENTVCDICGEEFEHPLFAELISGDHAEEYYACPRCLTKVGEVERQERVAVEEVDEADVEEDEETALVEEVVELPPQPEEAKPQDSSGCPYYLGYLKKRPKNEPIPENCFVCAKMIECTR
jgi:DNA-directed RNA polymerase subunit RPC12/RpoP